MKKEDKGLLIESLVETLNSYAHFYVVDMTALNSATTSALRRECYKSEVKLQVVKNTLFEKALGKLEGDFSALTLSKSIRPSLLNSAKPKRARLWTVQSLKVTFLFPITEKPRSMQ